MKIINIFLMYFTLTSFMGMELMVGLLENNLIGATNINFNESSFNLFKLNQYHEFLKENSNIKQLVENNIFDKLGIINAISYQLENHKRIINFKKNQLKITISEKNNVIFNENMIIKPCSSGDISNFNCIFVFDEEKINMLFILPPNVVKNYFILDFEISRNDYEEFQKYVSVFFLSNEIRSQNNTMNSSNIFTPENPFSPQNSSILTSPNHPLEREKSILNHNFEQFDWSTFQNNSNNYEEENNSLAYTPSKPNGFQKFFTNNIISLMFFGILTGFIQLSDFISNEIRLISLISIIILMVFDLYD